MQWPPRRKWKILRWVLKDVVLSPPFCSFSSPLLASKWPLYGRVKLQIPAGREARARVVELLRHAAGGGLMVWHLIGPVFYEFSPLIG